MEELRQWVERIEQRLERGFTEELTRFGESVLSEVYRQWPRLSWTPFAASTVRDKRWQGPLIRTGHLVAGHLIAAATRKGTPGNVFKVTPFSLEMGVEPESMNNPRGYPYAYVQFYGTRKTGHIPGRPWFNLAVADTKPLDEAIHEALVKAARGE
jgi:hypothetical protein